MPLTYAAAGSGCEAISVRLAVDQSSRLVPPTAIVVPSGEYATEADALPASSTGDGSVHIEAVPSASAAATRPAPSQATVVTGCGSAMVAVSARVAVFQTSTRASDVPAAR